MSNNKQNADDSPAALLEQLLEAHRGERHLIVLHDYPDPDAISSANAHKLISAAREIQADILYSGEISHQQNLALVKLLGLEVTRYTADHDLAPYEGAIFIDNQGNSAARLAQAIEEAGIPVLAVIDHHERQDRLQPELSDIRSRGSVASMYAEYLQHGLLDLDKHNKEHVHAATALLHGISTDTGGYVRAKATDFEAAAYLSEYGDADLLTYVMSQSRSKRVMNIIHQALGNRTVTDGFSISGVGYLRMANRDAIPQTADFLLTEENVHTAIVFGIVRDDQDEESVIGSLRTSKATLNPDKFIKDVFGKNMHGQYFGGGKLAAGGFEIPVGFLSGERTPQFDELKWQLYETQIREKIYERLGLELERPAE